MNKHVLAPLKTSNFVNEKGCQSAILEYVALFSTKRRSHCAGALPVPVLVCSIRMSTDGLLGEHP